MAFGQTATEPKQDVGQKTEQKGEEKKSEWIQLFNGKNLDGWIPKIRYHEAGKNFADTFRVENGVLKVAYDKYDGPFKERFGHLFYKKKFSNYILRVEYRFTGKQAKGGPGWAIRNSGLMLHGEDPGGMAKDQDFPASIEVQLLGGYPQKTTRPTLNLCTPGTNVMMNGKLHTRHCLDSKSKTYNGDQWVKIEVEVRGGEVIRHKVDGQVVLEYQNPQLDPRGANVGGGAKHVAELIRKNGGKQLLTGGTISLQSESHPCEFRKVELKVLRDK
jgi:hypothetical protein